MTATLDNAALQSALKECSDELAAWVEGHYRLMLHYPSEERRFKRDMGPVHRARALLAHPTTEPAKAEEPLSTDPYDNSRLPCRVEEDRSATNDIDVTQAPTRAVAIPAGVAHPTTAEPSKAEGGDG